MRDGEARGRGVMRVNTTLVINPKGGSGKTTVATNLASYFASKGVATTILDYDPQGSSLNWLRTRPLQAAKIHGANGAPQKTGLRTVQMHVPANTEQLIIDAPAGASMISCSVLAGTCICTVRRPVFCGAPLAPWIFAACRGRVRSQLRLE